MTDAAPLKVTGITRLYIVIGDPVAQVQSTHLYNMLSAERGFDAVFVPVQFGADTFETVIAACRMMKNLRGIIPTIPHKARMLSVVDEASPRARMVGAVNSIRIDAKGRWIGDAIDGVGYVAGLKAGGHDPKGKSVQLIGVGGAGASMAFALAEAGISFLRLNDLDQDKVATVQSRLAGFFPNVEVETGPINTEGMDIVANATPLGMAEDDPLPMDPDRLTQNQLVTDMIAAARAKGCPTGIGYEAVKGQAQANLEFFGLG